MLNAGADPGYKTVSPSMICYLAVHCHYFCQDCSYLPSHNVSPAFGHYQIILLSNIEKHIRSCYVNV